MQYKHPFLMRLKILSRIKFFLSLNGKIIQKATKTALAVCLMLITLLQEATFMPDMKNEECPTSRASNSLEKVGNTWTNR